ncbi:MAG: hypothetical protein JW722_07345 [Demequinaceae bacterium]|nr:hypothetical protein [Demequinaceae bacterium]
MSERIVVIGGVGGTHARLEDLDRATHMLADAAIRLFAMGRAIRAAGWCVSRIAVAPESLPVRERAAERLEWVDQGPGGATGLAAEIEGIAANLEMTITLLEDAERASESIWTKAGRLWDKGVAVTSALIWVPCKVVGAGAGTVAHKIEEVTPGWLPVHWIATGEAWVADTVNPDWTPDLTPLAYGDDLQAALGMADGGYRTLTALPGPVLDAVGLPRDLVTALSLNLALVSLALDELLGEIRGVFVFPVASRLVDAPTGVADLFRRLEGLSVNGIDGAGRIAIDRIDHPDGTRAWIVEIPGTQDWVPDGGSNVLDFTSNLLLMAVGSSQLTFAVEQAMKEAGIPPDEEVLMVGHSQGGIAAMQMVSNPSFAGRYSVTAVLTAAAPVGATDPHPGVKVMSLEHPSDTVPALDGTPNPDRPEWTTVRRDLARSDSEMDRRADGDIVKRHELPTYIRTAEFVDTSSDPSIRRWLRDTEAFWDDEGCTSTRTVFEVTRGAEGPDATPALPVPSAFA